MSFIIHRYGPIALKCSTIYCRVLQRNCNNHTPMEWMRKQQQQQERSAPLSSSSSLLLSSYSTTSTTNQEVVDRPFRILGIQQIAVGSAEREPLRHLWMNVLGLTAVQTGVRLEQENVIEDILKVGWNPISAVEIDLMTPIDINRSQPKVHSPPLHHMGMWVDNLPAAVEWMTNQHKVRFTPGGIRRGAAGYDVAFIHPKGNETHPVSGHGVLIELVQAPDEVIAAAANSK